MDEVKTGLIEHPWPGLEVSNMPKWDGRKYKYKAEYRMNTGYWRSEALFDARDDADALEQANNFIPKRKKTDVTYMILWKLWALEN